MKTRRDVFAFGLVAATGMVQLACAQGVGQGSPSTDTAALKAALASGARSVTGPPADYVLEEPLIIPPGVNFDLPGARFIASRPMPQVIEVAKDGPGPNRFARIGGFEIAGNRQARDGLLVGVAVNRTFSDISVKDVVGTGVVLNGTQNSLLQNVNIDGASICLEVLNGAGNLLVQRCSLHIASRRHLFIGRRDVPDMNLRLFGSGIPDSNSFARLMVEYGPAPVLIEVQAGNRNIFTQCELSSPTAQTFIEFGRATSFNTVDLTQFQTSKANKAIAGVDRGYRNSVRDPSFTNFTGDVVWQAYGQMIQQGVPRSSRPGQRFEAMLGGQILRPGL